jgi:type IV fimbrial biogenesis protein FimT
VRSLWKEASTGRGASLIETIFVLATTAILLGAGVPMLRDLVVGSRVTSGVNMLVADLAFARAESLKRSDDTMICESQDGISCTGQPNWSRGWLIFADANDSKQYDTGDTLLRVQRLESGNLFVSFDGSGSQGYRYLTYKPSGSAKSGTFYVCDRENGTKSRAVIVFYTGRARVSDRKSDGTQINCVAADG